MAFSMPSEVDGSPDPVLILRGSVLTAAEEQKKWAQEALLAVESKAAVMQECIDKSKGLCNVIRAAAQVLDELRTNLLEPQNYYELYMKVYNVMEGFAAYLEDAHRAGRHTLEDIYEQVQYCGYIVPRLYLLIAAGAVYIEMGEQPALEIMRDLVEMCKGVQHPTRGLFLRHYLLTVMKGKLPGDPGRPVNEDPNSEAGGTVADTANLLVQNFKEMNWLWIRMEAGSYVNRNGGSTNSLSTNTLTPQQQQSASARLASPHPSSSSSAPNSPLSPLNGQQRTLRAAQRTQQERRAMCVLVGMNLVRISQLDGITREVYVKTLLPQLLSIMVRYCEPLAQQYLFEVLIQVFPDEFHLFTIDKLFDAISRTVHGVDVPGLLRSLIERLCRYAMDVQDGVTDVSSPEEEAQLRDLFPMLLDRLSNMPVSYHAHIKCPNVIKRTSAIPPPAPMLLGTYVSTVRHLVTVALTLYGSSAKRRTMALSNIVDVVAAKFTAAAAAAAAADSGSDPSSGMGAASSSAAEAADGHPNRAADAEAREEADEEGGSDSRTKRTAAGNSKSAAATSSSSAAKSKKSATAAAETAGISPAAALAASQFIVHIINDCCASVEEVLGMEGIETLTACLPFLERRDVAMAVCDVALRGSTGAPLLPAVSKAATVRSSSSVGNVAVLKPAVVVTAPPPRPRPLTALEDVARLFELLDPLLVDQPDTPSDPQLIYKYNPQMEFVDEQHCVCRVLHLLSNEDPSVYMKMLTGVRKLLLLGGARRIPLTYPTLIALHRRAAVRLHNQYVIATKSKKRSKGAEAVHRDPAAGAGADGGNGEEESTENSNATQNTEAEVIDEAVTAAYTKNIRKCLSHLYSGDSKSLLEVYAVEMPLRALSEYVTCALTAEACGQSETSYTLFAEALTLYDAHVGDTPDQVTALVDFVNALAQMTSMPEENYEVLAAKVCQYASKLLKKQDQSRLIAVCATLFAKKQLSQENQQRVQECLRRALKLAGQVLALPQLQLYVQLLNVFLHFYTAKMGYMVSVDLVNELVEKINEASEAQREAVAGAASNLPDAATTTTAGESAEGKEKDGAGAGAAAAAAVAASSDGEAAAAFANVRLVYRNITKYIRSRQSAEESWGAIEV
ncbi:vacuolar sorting-associated-like protein [Leptomonas pyrrhocoris]|uniref:Vacuolar sorting-associated-like protein n=1 Tax=Leptomonas pyrrhocoris TaxID=157538 RepID=A0A0M9FXL3_LEPPY|nr:vacuolar sorting-associated-like protein [Leptomonas pyrrhocoris]KPA78165.1 vacuolar sorting-associated-like protein [Leptomonas pyrrhocoris]|eukprot:XP_015656604.1 vacuolar sorting-associated-like protein [Leptomonas pyrrhocoris]